VCGGGLASESQAFPVLAFLWFWSGAGRILCSVVQLHFDGHGGGGVGGGGVGPAAQVIPPFRAFLSSSWDPAIRRAAAAQAARESKKPTAP
jgi:hypothetical protein